MNFKSHFQTPGKMQKNQGVRVLTGTKEEGGTMFILPTQNQVLKIRIIHYVLKKSMLEVEVCGLPPSEPPEMAHGLSCYILNATHGCFYQFIEASIF
ncbi:BnaC01g30920D [Brassica napus]|uniref:BnaC01g30920D protein n=1 Tax=Brassica napus TaxID=3708 RepID=A0A078F7I5_BRANA|nr:BnaC01g30920D [Brassica napus]